MSADQVAPDAYDPRLHCGAWRKAPRVIGGIAHTHICRLDPGHKGRHRCHSGDRQTW